MADAKFVREFIRGKKVANVDAFAARLLFEAIIKGSPKASAEINKLTGSYAPVKIADTDVDGNDKPRVIVYLPDNARDK